ncbi:cystathionine beta-lyase [Streptococcus sp. ZY19097]|uniref:cystathionine beta-lyase n=1 Tax=Streptococcus sp. ZY19097 TaxID=3231906 RepID=UPI003459DD94
MTNYVDLALTYGGFTNLDRVYLENKLAQLSNDQKLAFITPPPSVINAYFAEIYQKQSPQAATDYYFDLSKNLALFTKKPSFDEVKPFIRLNLSGKAYGFVYENDDEEAVVFAENEEVIEDSLLFEIAQIFPHYKVYVEGTAIKMRKIDFSEEVLEDLTPATSLLSHVTKLKGNLIKISSFNQEELLELAQHFSGGKYYAYKDREVILYLKK